MRYTPCSPKRGLETMTRTSRVTLLNVGLVAALVVGNPAGNAAGNAQAAAQVPTQVSVPLPVTVQDPMPPTRQGLGPQIPPMPPMAVSQLEDARRSDAFEQTLSLSFAEPIAVRELLLMLVRDTNLSVVTDPDVDGTFTGELKNVTLRHALDLILHPLELEPRISENVLRVSRRQMITRIFDINYVAIRRLGMNMSGGMGGGYGGGLGGYGGGLGGYGGGVGGYGGGYGGGVGIGGYGGGIGSGSSADVFEEIGTGLQTLLSSDGRHNLDRKAGLLQVTDYPEVLEKIAIYLETYETRTLRQVHIMAKVIEVEMREEFSAGIDWATVFRSAGNTVAVTQQLAPTRTGSAFTMGVNIRDFKGLLEAFASQGKVNVMASPYVMAMNNEPAMMRVGTQDVFFVTTSQVDAGTGTLLQTSVVPQVVTEGITLNVTPQISADGIIHLSITPTITERTGTATSRLGDQVPIVSVRETDTLVRVHEGETIVIAGLMQERAMVDKSKVPLLGDVPVIGGLFRREERSKRKTDLVILLTPTMMSPSDIAATAAADQQRLYEEQRKPARK